MTLGSAGRIHHTASAATDGGRIIQYRAAYRGLGRGTSRPVCRVKYYIWPATLPQKGVLVGRRPIDRLQYAYIGNT